MITDTILVGYLRDFSDDFGYMKLDEPKQFEKFVNNIIFSRQYMRSNPTPELIDIVSTGNGQDTGFDGIGIIVNGVLIKNMDEYKFFSEKDFNLDISFIFIQSKARSRFSASEVENFYFGVDNFFNEKSSIPENENIKKIREIKNFIYKNDTLKFNKNPNVYMYYVAAGEWKEPKDIVARKDKCIQKLKEKNIFSDIRAIFYDTEKLKVLYKELKRKNIKKIQFSNRVSLPDITNVTQSFIGSLHMNEFLKIITDSEDNLQGNLFDDNVRHFQGNNKVNKEIENTLKTKDIQDALPILNNGITIIAKKIEQTGNNISLFDFQIVNGCQSAHVLFRNKEIIDDNTNIIVKIIETTNQSLINTIIKATNRQTQVTDEAFESLSEFHRNLEMYYEAKSKQIENPIYYERRSKQYDNDPRKIKSTQIITLAGQIQSYVATFLEQPHSTHRYYGELLNSNRSRLFIEKYKKYEEYYFSALILNRLDLLFRNKKLDKKFRDYKFQILYIAFLYFKELMEKSKNSKENKVSYDKIFLEHLNNIDDLEKIFHLAIDVINMELKKLPNNEKNEAFRLNKFTEMIKENIENQFSKP